MTAGAVPQVWYGLVTAACCSHEHLRAHAVIVCGTAYQSLAVCYTGLCLQTRATALSWVESGLGMAACCSPQHL